MRELRALVQERLTAAAEEIFALFERTIAEFEEELRREKEKQSKHGAGVQMSWPNPAGVQMSWPSPAGVHMSSPSPAGVQMSLSSPAGVQMSLRSPAGVQMSSPSPAGVPMSRLSPGLDLNQIKEEPEEQSVKQEEEQLPDVCVKTEESELQEETQGISAEPHERDTEHSSGAADNWRAVGDDNNHNKAFSDNKLNVHRKTDTGENPYSHSMHDQTYLQKSNQSHAEEFPYSCSVCKKGFMALSKLNRHANIHYVHKPYGCSFCKKTFSQKGHAQTDPVSGNT
ncbi:hypothetical protein WMY93_011853 [Mugilogobius chulae]|uniref:C2H2-type domain-containing protein n=1 Tax=Mugilogobius chulae TaxID=88201 RepID=A0AAW0P387_9GOBI